MLCRLCPTGLIEISNNCKSCDLEPFHVNALQHYRSAPPDSTSLHSQSSSIQFMARMGRAVERMLRWSERNRQRSALRDLADDQHLLNDLGLTRQQALDEANRPFWE